LFILTFVANVVVTLISLAVLPSRVAIHYGANGMANGWAPNYVNALLMTGTHVLLFCSIYLSSRFMFAYQRMINLPNKEYWLQPAILPQTKEKTSVFMWQIGIALFLFFIVIGLLSLQANMAKPVRLNEPILFSALGALLIYTVWWIIMFFRAFRIPGQRNNPNHQMHNTAHRRQ